jgi:hypothetical protein
MSAPEVPAAPPADLAVVVVNYNESLQGGAGLGSR